MKSTFLFILSQCLVQCLNARLYKNSKDYHHVQFCTQHNPNMIIILINDANDDRKLGYFIIYLYTLQKYSGLSLMKLSRKYFFRICHLFGLRKRKDLLFFIFDLYQWSNFYSQWEQIFISVTLGNFFKNKPLKFWRVWIEPTSHNGGEVNLDCRFYFADLIKCLQSNIYKKIETKEMNIITWQI